MITIFVHRDGKTEQAHEHRSRLARIRPPACTFWVDLAAPSIPESLILSDTFAFHPLSVEDAMSARQYPKAEAYDGYLYVILHGIDFTPGEQRLRARTTSTSSSARTTSSPSTTATRASITELRDHATRNPQDPRRRPGRAACTASSTRWSTHYRPEIDKLEDRLDELEKADLRRARRRRWSGEILDEKREVVGAAAHRHAAARRHRAGWRGAISSTSAPRCRSASATSTITWSASPTMR